MTVPVLNEGGNYGSREKVVEMVTDYQSLPMFSGKNQQDFMNGQAWN